MSKKFDEFSELCKPLIEYLNKNYHPHTKIIIDTTGGELVEGLMSCKSDKVKDDGIRLFILKEFTKIYRTMKASKNFNRKNIKEVLEIYRNIEKDIGKENAIKVILDLVETLDAKNRD